MKIDVNRANHLIEHWQRVAERSRREYERWMLKADREPDPERRAAFEAMANTEMTLANAMRADADYVRRRVEAAGDPMRPSPP